MNKPLIFVFDGVEASGKSTLIEKIYQENKERSNIAKVHFPSDELIKKHVNNINSEDETKVIEFINDLITYEEYNTLQKILDLKVDVILIDRMFISTFAYQGKTNFLKHLIKVRYEFLFENILEIPKENIFVFSFPNCLSENIERDKNKILEKNVFNKNNFKERIDRIYEFNLNPFVVSKENLYIIDHTNKELTEINANLYAIREFITIKCKEFNNDE